MECNFFVTKYQESGQKYKKFFLDMAKDWDVKVMRIVMWENTMTIRNEGASGPYISYEKIEKSINGICDIVDEKDS